MHFEEYYPASAFSCNVTQLSSGTLATTTVCAPIKDAHLEIFTSNQTLLYEEEANRQSVAFCWLGVDQSLSLKSTTMISGHKLHHGGIAGFNRLSKTGGNIWDLVGANETLSCMSLRWDRLKEKIDQMDAYNAFARLEECIGLDSDSDSSLQLKQLFASHFKTKGLQSSDKLYALAVACLEDPDESIAKISTRSDQTDLVEDLVKLIHEDRHGLQPITLPEISSYLDVKKDSLNKVCRDTFNMGVMELIQRIRLEQVRKALINPHTPQGLKLFTKERVALYYGFKSWDQFQEKYISSFQESPIETIERTSKTMLSFADALIGGGI